MQYDLQQYIGIPFLDHGRDRAGCDCWGLMHLVYAEQMGIYGMPDLGDDYSDAYARGEVSEAIEKTTAEEWNFDVTNGLWQPLDAMIFSRGGVEAHVGMYVRPNEMLHVVRGAAASIERYDLVRWKRRLTRVFRHVNAPA